MKNQDTVVIAEEADRKNGRRNFPISVAILGSAQDAKNLSEALSSDSLTASSSLRVAAIFADGLGEWAGSTENNIVVNDVEWAESFVECCGIRRGIIAIPRKCGTEIADLVKKSASLFKELYVAPDLTGNGIDSPNIRVTKRSRLEIEVKGSGNPSDQSNTRAGSRRLKRILDVVAASALGLVALPFLLCVIVAIALSSEGPVLFKQVRIGKGNRLFFALKFRTMFTDSAERLEQHLESDPGLRMQWASVHKLKKDPRVTPIGRLLRRFSLDELPQLWNVLVGDMSLIGPRPIVVSEIERYGLDYGAYESVRPGLTGLWQVSGRNDTTYDERVAFDSYYVQHWSLKLDARIALKTFRAVISGVGAY